MTRYRCLVLDHDDTAVMSTPNVHYPSFIDTMKKLRPDVPPIEEEAYFRMWFDSNFDHYCKNVLRFTSEEEDFQLSNWRGYVERIIPAFHDGMEDIIRRQIAEGGLVCVVSHSYSHYIKRDYEAAGLPQPHCMLGWEIGADKQKPHPYPLEYIAQKYNLAPSDILMVDDLKPGYDMSQAFGCDCALALWSYTQSLRDFITAGCPKGIPMLTTRDLANYLFSA